MPKSKSKGLSSVIVPGLSLGGDVARDMARDVTPVTVLSPVSSPVSDVSSQQDTNSTTEAASSLTLKNRVGARATLSTDATMSPLNKTTHKTRRYVKISLLLSFEPLSLFVPSPLFSSARSHYCLFLFVVIQSPSDKQQERLRSIYSLGAEPFDVLFSRGGASPANGRSGNQYYFAVAKARYQEYHATRSREKNVYSPTKSSAWFTTKAEAFSARWRTLERSAP
jgi:hypothetical protein